ncbi:MAG: hypothetical protein K8R77_01050 [Anaerolineaceae bacterium]|nr:hypothetical protein [Anaerolineaceae bacterium]
MLKKIIIGLVSVATLAVLIVGGINRTVAKTADVYGKEDGAGKERYAQSDGVDDIQPRSSAENRSEANTGKGRYAESNDVNDLQTRIAEYQGGNGQGRRAGSENQAEMSGEPLNLAEEQFTGMVELNGSINSVDLTEDVLIDTDGGQIILEGRSLSFAVSQGFNAQMGDEVLLEGFYEGTDFEIVQITNLTSGLVTTLREPTGRPLWAGGGHTW